MREALRAGSERLIATGFGVELWLCCVFHPPTDPWAYEAGRRADALLGRDPAGDVFIDFSTGI